MPGLDETMQEINHYVVQIGDQLPILVKNTTATLFTGVSNTNHAIRLRAVDMCGHEGEELVVTLEGHTPVTGKNNDIDTTTPLPYHGSPTTTEQFTTKATSFLDQTYSSASPLQLHSLSCFLLILFVISSFFV